MSQPAVLFLCVAAVATMCASGVSTQEETGSTAEPALRLLVFTKTAGFRHASIPAGIEAMHRLGREHDWNVAATEDAAQFTDERLHAVDVIVFLNTTGDVLNDDQQQAMERFIRRGGGFVGIHSATDTEYDWPWYGRLVGAYFAGHPAVQQAMIDVVEREHVSTKHLPVRWRRTDEWYNFRAPPQDVTVLARLDESTYEGGTMGDDHPAAWCHEFDGGRAWYTASGHTAESFSEPEFLRHLRGGVEWAGRKTSTERENSQ